MFHLKYIKFLHLNETIFILQLLCTMQPTTVSVAQNKSAECPTIGSRPTVSWPLLYRLL